MAQERVVQERDRGASWLGWVAGLGAAVTAAGVLAFNYTGETVEPKAKAQAEAPVTAPVTAAAKVVAEAVVPKAETAAEVEVAAPAPADAPAEKTVEPAVAAAVPGVTNYYGVGDGSQVMAWSADAIWNPE